jgi:hypothetical protein
MAKKRRSRPQAQKSANNYFSGIRGDAIPAGFRHRDKRKEAEKKACRGKVVAW